VFGDSNGADRFHMTQRFQDSYFTVPTLVFGDSNVADRFDITQKFQDSYFTVPTLVFGDSNGADRFDITQRFQDSYFTVPTLMFGDSNGAGWFDASMHHFPTSQFNGSSTSVSDVFYGSKQLNASAALNSTVQCAPSMTSPRTAGFPETIAIGLSRELAKSDSFIHSLSHGESRSIHVLDELRITATLIQGRSDASSPSISVLVGVIVSTFLLLVGVGLIVMLIMKRRRTAKTDSTKANEMPSQTGAFSAFDEEANGFGLVTFINPSTKPTDSIWVMSDQPFMFE
jgi:predicted nucleic acid-binding Zn ribbon protein